MSLDDQILGQEFGSKNSGNPIDAEYTQTKPRSKRLIPALVGCGALILLGAGAFFYDGVSDSVAKVKNNATKPSVVAAVPPAEIAPTLPGDAPEPKAETDSENTEHGAAEPIPTALISGNGATDPSPHTESPAPVLNVPVKVESVTAPVAQPVNEHIKENERLAKLEQKYIDLASSLEGINKKLEIMAETAAAKPSVPAKVQTVRNEERPRPQAKEEVTKSMKELKITALLSDGVVFEGDIAVPVGQYSKTLKGKIQSISPDSNTITTDNRIYKVQ